MTQSQNGFGTGISLNLKKLCWKQVCALLLCLSALIGSLGYAVHEGAISPTQSQGLIGNLAQVLSERVDQLNASLQTSWTDASGDPTFYTTQQPYAYVISNVSGYACMQLGTSGALLAYNLNSTLIEQWCIQNASGGVIYSKQVPFNSTLQSTLPTNVAFIDSEPPVTTKYTASAQLVQNDNLGVTQYYYQGTLISTINMSAASMTLAVGWSQIQNANVTVQQIAAQYQNLNWQTAWNSFVIPALLWQNLTVNNIASTQPIALYNYLVYLDPIVAGQYDEKAANGTILLISNHADVPVNSGLRSVNASGGGTVYVASGNYSLSTKIDMTMMIHCSLIAAQGVWFSGNFMPMLLVDGRGMDGWNGTAFSAGGTESFPSMHDFSVENLNFYYTGPVVAGTFTYNTLTDPCGVVTVIGVQNDRYWGGENLLSNINVASNQTSTPALTSFTGIYIADAIGLQCYGLSAQFFGSGLTCDSPLRYDGGQWQGSNDFFSNCLFYLCYSAWNYTDRSSFVSETLMSPKIMQCSGYALYLGLGGFFTINNLQVEEMNSAIAYGIYSRSDPTILVQEGIIDNCLVAVYTGASNSYLTVQGVGFFSDATALSVNGNVVLSQNSYGSVGQDLVQGPYAVVTGNDPSIINLAPSNTLTLSGGCTQDSPQGIIFNGVNGKAIIPSSVTVQPTTQGTVSFWFKSNGTEVSWSGLICKSISGGTNGISYRINEQSTTLQAQVSNGTSMTSVSVTVNWANTGWNCAVLRWNSTSVYFTVNTTSLSATAPLNGAQSIANPLVLGYSPADNYAPIELAYVQIAPTCITDSQAAMIYTNGLVIPMGYGATWQYNP